MRISALLWFFTLLAAAQTQPVRVPHPTNLEFREGEPGSTPTGWHLPQIVSDAGYRAELRKEGCGGRFTTCVAYLPPPAISGVRAAELAQLFPAGSYAGKTVRFSAWLRMQDPSEGYVHIRTRVYYPNHRSEMFDEAGQLVNSPEWQRRDVFTRVGTDAVEIAIWARYVPGGFAWVAAPSLEIVDWAPPAIDDANVRRLIDDFSEHRNAHDGPGVSALYLEDGQYLQRNGQRAIKGRAGLAALWGGVDGHVRRIIQSVDFPSASVAVVRVVALYADSTKPSVHHDAFVIVKQNGSWYIQDHQALD